MKEQKIIERVADRTLRCMLCKKQIPSGSKFLDKEGFISCTAHREWLGKVVIPVTRHKYQYRRKTTVATKEKVMLKPETKLMYEIFGCYATPDKDEDFLPEVDGVTLHDAIIKVLDLLEEKGSNVYNRCGKRIILARFGFESPDGSMVILDNIARGYNVSRERIRQLLAQTLRFMRHPSRSRTLRAYVAPREESEDDEV
jgi:hypothetical protein